MSIDPDNPLRGTPLIPGAYERNTRTHRQPGSMGTAISAALPVDAGSMAQATITEREREGGGAPRERHRNLHEQGRTGPALRATEGNGRWFTGGNLWFQILRLARR
jgi:hypothetical protein